MLDRIFHLGMPQRDFPRQQAHKMCKPVKLLTSLRVPVVGHSTAARVLVRAKATLRS